jgi:phosphopantetheinyl transferase
MWVCKEALLKASGKGWLRDEKEFSFQESCIFKRILKNECFKDKITYPYYFECIPGYASALFVEGSILQPLYYTWK